MRHPSLDAFLRAGAPALARGPALLLLVEDEVEVESTLRHHLAAGFRAVAAFADPLIDVPGDDPRVHRVDLARAAGLTLPDVVNAVLPRVAPGTWIGALHNAEYLFHPFREHRTVGELCSFVAEERRASVLCFTVDLYAGDLGAHPSGVSLEDAHLDRTGYYALARPDPATGHPKERQLDFFGGLRWRFEEQVPPARRRIDRVALFRAARGLRMRPDWTLSDEELNTYECPWHHSPTAAICSFRAAKALRRNPGSRWDIPTFRWHNSVPFEWGSRQLMDLGLMEPGQWF